jgi:hypothetical protein
MSTIFRTVAAACTLGLAVAVTVASPAQAQQKALGKYQALGEQYYNDPYEPPHGLRFSVLEAAIGTDPLTWSSDPGWQLHRTPEAQLAEATDVIRAAIPVGTAAADAAALLHKAGARCATSSDAQVVCHYRDAETPYAGEYFDNVLWRVWLDTDGGRVTHVEVTRDWTRH